MPPYGNRSLMLIRLSRSPRRPAQHPQDAQDSDACVLVESERGRRRPGELRAQGRRVRHRLHRDVLEDLQRGERGTSTGRKRPTSPMLLSVHNVAAASFSAVSNTVLTPFYHRSNTVLTPKQSQLLAIAAASKGYGSDGGVTLIKVRAQKARFRVHRLRSADTPI